MFVVGSISGLALLISAVVAVATVLFVLGRHLFGGKRLRRRQTRLRERQRREFWGFE